MQSELSGVVVCSEAKKDCYDWKEMNEIYPRMIQ